MSNFISYATRVYAQSLLSRLTLCDPIPCSPPGSSVHGIFPSKNTGVCGPCHPPGDLPYPGVKPLSLRSPALAGGFFTTSATWEAPGHDTSLGKTAYVVVSFHSISITFSNDNSAPYLFQTLAFKQKSKLTVSNRRDHDEKSGEEGRY